MRYSEIYKLKSMLEEANIPFEFNVTDSGGRFEHNQIAFPTNGDDRLISVIEGFGTYGSEQDLLEIMGLLSAEEEESDSVRGWLTADDVFNRIKSAAAGAEHIQSK